MQTTLLATKNLDIQKFNVEEIVRETLDGKIYNARRWAECLCSLAKCIPWCREGKHVLHL